MKTYKVLSILAAWAAALLLTTVWLSLPQETGAAPITEEAAHLDPWLQLVMTQDAREEGTKAPNNPQAVLSLNLDLHAYRIAGHTSLPTPVQITITRQGAVHLHETVTPIPDALSYIYMTELDCDYDCDSPFIIDDVLWVRQGSSVLSMTHPTLTVLPDAQGEMLTGEAPAATDLTAYRFPFDDPNVVYSGTITSDAAGKYNLSLPGLRPRDDGYLLLELDASRRVYQRYRAPFLRLQANGYTVAGQVLDDQSVRIDYPTAFGYITELQSWSGQNGYFDGSMYSYDKYYFLPLTPGTTIHARTHFEGQVFSSTVQTITAHADLANNQVSGQTAPGQEVTILLYEGPLSWRTGVWDGLPSARRTTTADASGRYAVSLPLGTSSYGIALVGNGDGHQSFDWFAVPYAEFGLGWHNRAEESAMRGQTEGIEAPLTVEVQGPSGYLKSQYQIQTAFTNGSFPVPYPGPEATTGLALESGDRVTVIQAEAAIIDLILPTLTLAADYQNAWLYGEAPPNAALTLAWGRNYQGYTEGALEITASPTGEYQVPFAALDIDLKSTDVAVYWHSPQGYKVWRSLNAHDTCQVTPERILVGGNEVWLYGGGRYCDENITLQLFDAENGLKAEAQIPHKLYVYQFEAKDGKPIPIMAGDTLKMSYAGESESYPIPTLDVQIEPDNHRVRGHAEPGQAIDINYIGESYHTDVMTATSQGVFTYTLPGNATLRAGDQVRVTYQQAAIFSAIDVLPFWEIYLTAGDITGDLPPLTPYTVTLNAADGITGTASGYADSNGYWQVSHLAADGFNIGDELHLHTPKQAYPLTIPLVSAALNQGTATVTGQVPPQGDLSISLEWDYRLDWRWPEIAPDGTYSAVFPEAAGQGFLKVENY